MGFRCDLCAVLVPWHLPVPLAAASSSRARQGAGVLTRAEAGDSGFSACREPFTDGRREANCEADSLEAPSSTVYRYYHVFTQAELLALCEKAGGMRVLECYFDCNNWAVVLQRLESADGRLEEAQTPPCNA